LHIRWASIINLSSLRYLPTDSDGFASGREERHPLRRVSAFFPRGEFVAVCRRNPKAGSCGFCTMFYRFGRNAAERMYRKLRSRHLVQAFASRHPLRRDVSTTMIYNPKDRSIPLPSLQRGGRRHRVSISARWLRTSCGRITELLECAVAARAVQAEALRRIQVGLSQQEKNPITEPRSKRPRGSGRP
jgi:hypothetical protein